MNPVNATALYVSASRLVLNYDPGDPQSFTEINKLLPYFRQSLSCCVCAREIPIPVYGFVYRELWYLHRS
ncbi:e3 ubiquitin-protein ligase msl2 [Limosa lapponica baueri]|uniref:E3 ubiquitin-protein ligase msl2 n=1 Tax=Limosa lapponica baueri TaxID=1758121 RepID=A0A2I0TFI5_LIMLA|nr:e3 ubiquitin-protein ligase msl2 [Limosa lapponica baueri]